MSNFSSPNSTNQTFDLEARFEAAASSTGTAVASAGSNLRTEGLGLSNNTENTSSRFVAGTAATLLDSATLASDTTIVLTFENIDDADSATVDALENDSVNAASLAGIYLGDDTTFASDILNLEGLDATLHVLELSYDEEVFFAEETAQLLWQTSIDADGVTEIAWVNAVLGNSDVLSLDFENLSLTTDAGEETIFDYLDDRRHEGSYLTYLDENGLQEAELGAWGVDAENNTVWAAIDHNSSFAAAGGVPEPSSTGLISIALGALVLFRKRPRN